MTTTYYTVTQSSSDQNITIESPTFDTDLNVELFFVPTVGEWRFNATHPKFGISGRMDNCRLRKEESMFEIFTDLLGYRLIFDTQSQYELYTQDITVSGGMLFRLEDSRE